MMNTIAQLRKEYSDKMDKANEEVWRHLDGGGSPLCDYVQGRKDLSTYYRGALNVIIELERILQRIG